MPAPPRERRGGDGLHRRGPGLASRAPGRASTPKGVVSIPTDGALRGARDGDGDELGRRASVGFRFSVVRDSATVVSTRQALLDAIIASSDGDVIRIAPGSRRTTRRVVRFRRT